MGDIKRAKDFASKARLPDDILLPGDSITLRDKRSGISDHMLRHGLLISRDLTPDIDRWLADVCSRLGVPRSSVTAFVYNDSAIQADCFTESSRSCVLRFSSGLINLMSEQEFKFVAGHEIGHFLLEHGSCSHSKSPESAESFSIQRAGELSADRLGLLATEGINSSLKAILKTASGLDESFLRFDFAAFQRQANEISEESNGEAQSSTHPSMLMRCRALLWFSMLVESPSDFEALPDEKLSEINERVEVDLRRLVDGQVRQQKEKIEEDIALWKAILLIYHSGGFPHEVQQKFAAEFGNSSLLRAKEFFKLFQAAELEDHISSRLASALRAAEEQFPVSHKSIENSAFTKAYAGTD